ncbi:MAG: twin-arginine translocase TatA/TatE family subunit [bacterium]|nr:twin-arginine translocase TatA/TatE family subunit [bacterium]
MGKIGVGELLLILAIVLLLFGANKIPQIAKSLGQGIKEFKKANKGEEEELKNKTKGGGKIK